jgi:hypothetical protein
MPHMNVQKRTTKWTRGHLIGRNRHSVPNTGWYTIADILVIRLEWNIISFKKEYPGLDCGQHQYFGRQVVCRL